MAIRVECIHMGYLLPVIGNSSINKFKIEYPEKGNCTLVASHCYQLQLIIFLYIGRFIDLLFFKVVFIDLRIEFWRNYWEEFDDRRDLVQLMKLDIFCPVNSIGLLNFARALLDSEFKNFPIFDKQKILIMGVRASNNLLDALGLKRRINVLNINFVQIFGIQLLVSDLKA